MDEQEFFKFVIVGHVDHGKSTLIGRLLYDTRSLPADRIEEMRKISRELGREAEFAYLLDHLEEERQQGITIDTTQVFFKTPKRNYVIIDAPGHVEFVKNMVTGASQADGAVLIVDAKEGVKEQTRRHAYILSLLGLKQVIVAVNKMDLADFQRQKFDDTKRALEPFMKSAGLEVLSYIPISAVKGDNVAKRSKAMDWYEGPTLLECLDRLEGHPSTQDKPLIFPVQDVYRVDEMRIIVGRLEAGRIRAGETVKVLPSGRTAKISSIEKYPQKKVREAGTGESIGVTTEEDVFVDRGDVICLPGEEPFLTDKFSATIFWMAPEPLDTDERLVVRCATQETSCVIECVGKRVDSSTFEVIGEDSKTLKNLEVGEVVIKTKKPLAIKAFGDVRELGRFVLVRDQNICAGGIITEADGSL